MVAMNDHKWSLPLLNLGNLLQGSKFILTIENMLQFNERKIPLFVGNVACIQNKSFYRYYFGLMDNKLKEGSFLNR